MILLEIDAIHALIHQLGLKTFYMQLFEILTEDFKRWDSFQKSPRHAFYVPNGVIELMPICNDHYYSFKYVNGHPSNPHRDKMNVVALGMLADVESGYPLMLASMTWLTALRTAAMSALSSFYLAKPGCRRLAMIGCGAQSECQIMAHHVLFDLEEVRYFDRSDAAMKRLAANLKHESFRMTPANTVQEAIADVDIIVTATASPGHQVVLQREWLQSGQHICAIGGDSPGKTELDPEILKHSKVVVEYLPQTLLEGEIQNLGPDAHAFVHAEFWELVSDRKPGRVGDEISVFDGVGFALEDFSVLRLCYQLAQDRRLGKTIRVVPDVLEDSKDLYGAWMRDKP